jgi:membrane protease YdiL (CAAX protease family)
MIAGIKKVRSDTKNDETLLASLESFRWLMPVRIVELRYFLFGVSTSAGICEEIIFRGFLFGSLLDHFGMPTAILISSIAFGLPHIYQGVSGVIKTSVLGVLFACVYWISGSLLLAIVLHIIIDLYSGSLGYVVLSRNGDVSK